MVRLSRSAGRASCAVLVCVAAIVGAAPGVHSADPESIKRGEYLFHGGGCDSCHTDIANKGAPLAGGPAIRTAFGTFYGPNITPDPQHGIGKWTDAQFERALRHGMDEDGDYLFPVFPYTSFTLMTDADVKDLRAYLATVPPSGTASKPQEVGFPFSWRFLQIFWRGLYFRPGPFAPDQAQSEEWNRGAYLATALVHCGECHTPRNFLGGLDRDRWMIGTRDGPNGHVAPNITSDKDTGIGGWTVDDLVQYLATGQDPKGGDAAFEMAEVIQKSTSKLTDADLKAIAVYIKSLKPVRNAVKSK